MIKTVKMTDIKPYENNPRKNDKAVDVVKKSIEQCGYCNPIIVDEDMVILAGHTRYKALKRLGWKEAPVYVKEGLTEAQKRKYRIYDNKAAENSSWDQEKLEEELEGLDFGDLIIPWGIDEKETVMVNKEFSTDIFADEKFKYTCPCCGFRFNK